MRLLTNLAYASGAKKPKTPLSVIVLKHYERYGHPIKRNLGIYKCEISFSDSSIEALDSIKPLGGLMTQS